MSATSHPAAGAKVVLAARRAVVLYWRMLRSGEVVWDKTEHEDNEGAPVDALARVVVR